MATIDWDQAFADGGMFIWFELPGALDTTRLLQKAFEAEHIAFVPGQSFFAHGDAVNYLRLNYTLASERDIRDGVARLSRLIYRQMNELRSSDLAGARRS